MAFMVAWSTVAGSLVHSTAGEDGHVSVGVDQAAPPKPDLSQVTVIVSGVCVQVNVAVSPMFLEVIAPKLESAMVSGSVEHVQVTELHWPFV